MTSGRGILLLAGLVLAVVCCAIRLSDPDPVRDLRLTYFDYLQRLAPRPASDLPVRVVDIDETALANQGQWPWPRDRLAALQTRLADAGAAVVVYDVLFAEPDRLSPHRVFERQGLEVGPRIAQSLPDTDRVFADSLRQMPVVLGTARIPNSSAGPVARSGFVEVGNAPRNGLPEARGFTPIVPLLDDAAVGVGSISISATEAGGAVRTLPLAWVGPEGLMPSLSLEALRLAFGQSTLTLYGAGDLEANVDGVAVGDLYVPTTSTGELWLHFRPDDPDLYLSAQTVLEADIAEWRAAVEGQIVLIGTSAAGLLDIRTTALGEAVPGVSIHAQAIEQILSGDFLTRSDAVAGFEVLALFVIVLAVAGGIAVSGPLFAIGIGVLGIGGLLAVSWLMFVRTGTLFDAANPTLAAGLTFTMLAAYRLIVLDRERRAIRKSFSHYVAPQVLSEVERQGHNLSLGGETRDVTVLFSDVRGFTSLSEKLDAEDLVRLLNEMFDAFGPEITRERGTIDKFIGDAVMAFWNAPVDVPDHPAKAVSAAVAMRGALRGLNANRTVPIQTAIGIATGPASVGNLGSRDLFNYSAVGSTVNLASRIEAACRDVEADIMVSDAVARAAPDHAYLDAGALKLRGFSDRVPAWVVVGGPDLASSEAFSVVARRHSDLVQRIMQGEAPPPVEIADLAQQADVLLRGLGAFISKVPGRASDYQA